MGTRVEDEGGSVSAGTITREGVRVKVGQMWRDLDERTGTRICTVITAKDGYATMSVNGAHPYRTTRVKIARMHKTSTGWALVSDAGAAP